MEKTLSLMFENAVHIGHKTQKWNPKMKKFIYGEKNGIHLIDIEKTVAYLERAMQFASKSVTEGKIVLFVSTKPQSVRLIESTAKEVGMPFVVSKWIPGLLTNFSTVKMRIKYLIDLKEQEKTGELEKYTKKEVSKLKKMMEKLEISLGGVQTLTSKPDVVFVADVVRDAIVVKEAKKLGIPVIGIVDTNADPTTIDYPIPGNDDALKSLSFLVGKIAEGIMAGRKTKK